MKYKNQKVFNLINQIKTEVVNNGKDMYIYIASILCGDNYEDLEEDYSNNDSYVIKYVNAIRGISRGDDSYLDFPVVVVGGAITTVSQRIEELFSIEDKNGCIESSSIFRYLFGYLEMMKLKKLK